MQTWIFAFALVAGFAAPVGAALLLWRTRTLTGERAIGLAASTWVLLWSTYFVIGGGPEWLRTGDSLLLAATALALFGGLLGLLGALMDVRTVIRRMLYAMAGALTFLLMYVSLLSIVHFLITPVVVVTFLALAIVTGRNGAARRHLDRAPHATQR
ncbi:MAG: hypothetical protein WD645_07035 [Dehalococcoidia bacterium]